MPHNILQDFTDKILTPTKQNGATEAPPVVHLRARLAELCTQQGNLADAREQLLIDRESGMVRRKEVQRQRALNRDAEIVLMNEFRNHFVKLDRPLPDDLLNAYGKVQEQNLALRRLEEDTVQEEEDLGASEWHFMEQETELYQYHIGEVLTEELGLVNFASFEGNASTHVLPESTSSGEKLDDDNGDALTTEYNQLVRRFETLRRQQSIRMDTYTTLGDNALRKSENLQLEGEIVELAGKLLELIVSCETRLIKRSVDFNASRKDVSSNVIAQSEPSSRKHPWYDDDDSVSHARSENAVSQYMDSVSVSGKVLDWSLDMLKNNAVEKLHYLNVLGSHVKHSDTTSHTDSPSIYRWESLVTETWQADAPGLNEGPIEELGPQDNASKEDPEASPKSAEILKHGSSVHGSGHIEEEFKKVDDMNEAEGELSPGKQSEVQVRVALVETVEFQSSANESNDLLRVIPLTSFPNHEFNPLLDSEDLSPSNTDGVLLCVEKPNTGSQPLKRCDSAQGSEMGFGPNNLPAPESIPVTSDSGLRFEEALIRASANVRKYDDNVQHIHNLWKLNGRSCVNPIGPRSKVEKSFPESGSQGSRMSPRQHQATGESDDIVVAIRVAFRSRKLLKRGEIFTLPRNLSGMSSQKCATELSAFIAIKSWGHSASGVLIRRGYGEGVWKSRPRFISIELLESFGPPA